MWGVFTLSWDGLLQDGICPCRLSLLPRHRAKRREYGPAKTLYNRWKRWRDERIFISAGTLVATDIFWL